MLQFSSKADECKSPEVPRSQIYLKRCYPFESPFDFIWDFATSGHLDYSRWAEWSHVVKGVGLIWKVVETWTGKEGRRTILHDTPTKWSIHLVDRTTLARLNITNQTHRYGGVKINLPSWAFQFPYLIKIILSLLSLNYILCDNWLKSITSRNPCPTRHLHEVTKMKNRLILWFSPHWKQINK